MHGRANIYHWIYIRISVTHYRYQHSVEEFPTSASKHMCAFVTGHLETAVKLEKYLAGLVNVTPSIAYQ